MHFHMKKTLLIKEVSGQFAINKYEITIKEFKEHAKNNVITFSRKKWRRV